MTNSPKTFVHQKLSAPTLIELDPALKKTLKKDKRLLEKTQIPMITVSATYKEDLKGLHGLKEVDNIPDIVLSRAHYSMTLGVAIQAWGKHLNPKKAWVADPTNYVSNPDWNSIVITETIGKILARHPLLKQLKDVVDKFGRSKLPILQKITPPLLYLTQDITKPILSFHIAAGNILIEQGKKVVQMITDPHVREDYLTHADNPNMTYLVFDKPTKIEALLKAKELGKKLDENRVIVTGPPVDPRVIMAKKQKQPWNGQDPLKICITTGGLGTNKPEMEQLLTRLIPLFKQKPSPFKIMVYAATHKDIYQMVKDLASKHHVGIQTITIKDSAWFSTKSVAKTTQPQDEKHPNLSVIYHPQIVEANELLIKYGFPWADGFISKPSGDMAYDAAASGSFLLTLAEWGEWEHNVRRTFEDLNIARRADVENIVLQLTALSSFSQHSKSWITQAMEAAQNIDPLFITGAKNIINSYKKI